MSLAKFKAVKARHLFAPFVMGLISSCITPSIPIPPPDPGQMSFEIEAAAGVATFSYAPSDVNSGALVYVLNRAKGVGVIDTARADGGIGPTAPFPATAGDQVVVSFQRDGHTVSTCVAIRSGRQSTADLCR